METVPVQAAASPPPFEAFYAATVFLADRPAGGWPEVFAVVTAENPPVPPGERELSWDEVQRRMHELSFRLRRDGHNAFPVIGASPDLSHQERGEGVPTTDLAYIARLASAYGQWGFFWIQQGEVYICCDASGKGWHIGDWEEKLRDVLPWATTSQASTRSPGAIPSVKINNQRDELFVKTSPGGRWYRRNDDGTYRCGMFVLGGSGSSTYTAEELAVDLWRFMREDPVPILKELGWDDAVEQYLLHERQVFEPEPSDGNERNAIE